MEALTHLCAAGMLPGDEKIYILSIDPDTGNGNLNRSSAALKCFKEFQNSAVGADTALFKTKVEIANPFPWNPTEVDTRLDDIMQYQTYKGTPIGNLYEVLYTRDERNTFLNEGFRGRPSIGAAVMAKKIPTNSKEKWSGSDSAPWDRFFELVKQDKDGSNAKIFLVGSAFGGTGAAGMPTIARLLHDKFKDYENIYIGGALILPYFSFTPANENLQGQIFASSENFLTNTKAALKYYAMKLKDTNVYDSLYFVGDDVLEPVKKFSVGAATQLNDAHIVDFYSALAAIDFYQADPRNLKKFSYINHTDANVFNWSDFPSIEVEKNFEIHLKERFVQFTRFIFSYLHLIKPVFGSLSAGALRTYQYPWFVDYLQFVDYNSAEVQNFEKYAESFVLWIKQLETNNRRVELIKTSSFDVQTVIGDLGRSYDAVFINPATFSNFAFEEDEIDVHEIFYRLTEHKYPESENTKGFGRFLRTLYDCCSKNY